MLYIGIDLGTSAVKLLLVDENGTVLNKISRRYAMVFPYPSWCEQNPEIWIHETMLGITDLISACRKDQIAGIGISGQMHGLVILDKDDKIIRPAILWNDNRATQEVDYLNRNIGKRKLVDYTANIAFTGFTAPKLLWLKKNEPDNFAKIKKIMLPKDYVNYILTGVYCSDYSDASGLLLLDVQRKNWSDQMLEVCGISHIQMPHLFDSYESIGTIRPEIAKKLGLSESVIVAAGAGDNAGAAIGTGTVEEGSCNISIGTSGTIFFPSKKFRVDSANALHTFVNADGYFHLMGVVLSAGSCNQWWMEEILETSDYYSEQLIISNEKLGKNHVFFLPYLMGERSPINDPNARGTIIGLTMDNTRADITQAVLEGVAFAIRDSLEVAKKNGLDVKTSHICGGGAKSTLWKKIFANICNVKIESVSVEEGPSYGSAILAMVACREYPDIQSAAHKLIKTTHVENPVNNLVALYEDRYNQFKEIYPSVKKLFPLII